ncbi:hypothetical protein SAMN05518672_101309 [Chitinophaga sp. CF118]|uniref:hypothetical protein n=1 Tax=Chitinophaga sp. CF118 TaxID=1884367 RepID=UPI0008ED1622|nr:hypothetical protein [Chitinophaga sp. CF118]SFD06810.1 hypothetical protein SAMN05518672_101309 [Chitinophaga sp. CF118]
MRTMNCSGVLLCLFLLLSSLSQAQQLKLGIAPAVIEKSALLELNSTNQGLLLPRVSDYTTTPLNTAPDGMLIYYVPDKLLYIKKNGIWRKLIDETNAITSVNGMTTSIVNLTTNDIPESANLYYTDARARSAFSSGTGINLSGAGVISALNTSAIWNASQLQGRNISTNIPSNNDVLTWDNTSSTWLPKSATTGSVTSVALALPSSVFNVSGSPVTSTGTLTGTFASQTQNQVFAAPVAANGVPSFRALVPLDIPAGSTSYIQNISSGTQTANYSISGNGSIGGTLNLPSLTTGSVPFIGASGLVSQNNTNFFWDNTNNRLGLGTNTPNRTLEVGGTVPASGLSGLRLTGMGAATLQSPLTNVLALNATGDVIVTSNPASNNWLITGNTGVNSSTQFLGTTDDVKMVIKSNNNSFLEFGRRQTLGLVQAYTDYTDNDEKVTYVRSALQFEVPAAVSFYKPKMWTTSDGNFRMKGPSAGTDYFEFGATGTANNGGFEFIIGDDGDEPIVFKSYYYVTAATTEIMRLQNNNVGIGLAGATPVKRLHIDANNDAIRIVNLASSGTGNPLVVNATGDIKQTTALDGVTVGATTKASGAFTTIAGATAPYAAGSGGPTINNMVIGSASFIRITGPTAGFTITGIVAGVDGQMVTLYNTTSNSMTISNLNASSSAANMIITCASGAGNISTTGAGTVTLVYSGTDARWVVTASNQ